MMDGICTGCGKIIIDISQEICEECRAKISRSEQTWQEYIEYLEGMGKLIEAERDKLQTEKGALVEEIDIQRASIQLLSLQLDELQAENIKLQRVVEIVREYLRFDTIIGLDIKDDAADNQPRRIYGEFICSIRNALSDLEVNVDG